MAKILVGLSGGVDSAVTAYLLMQQGHEVAAAFMHNWHADNFAQCSASDDYSVASSIAEFLKIPLYSLDFSMEYYQEVFEPFLVLLQQNLTPNPDILCNKNIKFKYLLNYALNHGFDYIATGHYAKIIIENNKYYLVQAKDFNKDQTYFLHQLQQQQLAKTIFPLGDYNKAEVRALAKSIALPNYDKKESMGICFIGQNNFNNFIEPYLIRTPGKIVDVVGNVLGEHKGLCFYTIGQRKGIGIGGSNIAGVGCWYVIAKDIKTNNLIVSQDAKHELLYKQVLQFTEPSWINEPAVGEVKARIRHRQVLQDCIVEGQQVDFMEPQRAIAPGQFVVFYKDNKCLGGAMISNKT